MSALQKLIGTRVVELHVPPPNRRAGVIVKVQDPKTAVVLWDEGSPAFEVMRWSDLCPEQATLGNVQVIP